MRLCTYAMPSTVSSSPATQPSSVERNSRRPIRAVMSTARVPMTATMNRQPNGVMPNICSPSPISHLPPGGCTTYDGSPVQMPLRWPARIFTFAGSGSPSFAALM